MKRSLISILIVCLIYQFTGCYSFSTLDNVKSPDFADYEDTEMKVTLVDGRIIESDAFLHTSNFNQTNFIIGKGYIFDPSSNIQKPFEGKILFANINSRITKGKLLTLKLNNRKEILFRENNYLTFSSETPKGNWLIMDNEVTMIENEKIGYAEISKFNPFLFFGSVLLVPVVLAGFMFLIVVVSGTQPF